MDKNIFKTLLFSFMVLFGALFINIDGVKADIPFCETSDEFEQAVSCDYPNKGLFTTQLDLTVYFGKTTTGKYCAEIKNVKLTSWADFNDSDKETKRGKVAFDLTNNTMNRALTTNSCPKLKFVNDYDGLTSATKKFTVSDKDMNSAACTASQLASFGSECWVLPGEGFKTIASSAMKDTVNESAGQRDIEKIDKNDTQKIKEWGDANSEGNYSIDTVGDECGVITPELKDLISTILWIIDIIGILLLIVMTVINFIQAITGSDEEKLRDALKHLRVRVIVVFVLLLLPVIVSAIITIINHNAGGVVEIGADGQPFCNIEK